MATVSYKCPNCASPLIYEGEKMKCTACDSLFDIAEIEALNMPQKPAEFEMPTQTYVDADAEQLHAYRCGSCGAELVTEGTTTATQCPYCGSPAILPDRIDGGIRPEMVVPFVVTKEQAQKLFNDYFKEKNSCPTFSNRTTRLLKCASFMCRIGCLTVKPAAI